MCEHRYKDKWITKVTKMASRFHYHIMLCNHNAYVMRIYGIEGGVLTRLCNCAVEVFRKNKIVIYLNNKNNNTTVLIYFFVKGNAEDPIFSTSYLFYLTYFLW